VVPGAGGAGRVGVPDAGAEADLADAGGGARAGRGTDQPESAAEVALYSARSR
jgi:hypothetical protein